MRVSVFGLGYVGLSIAVLLAKQHDVLAVDVVERKIQLINDGITPLEDALIQNALQSGGLSLRATLLSSEAYEADLIIVATPTNYDSHSQAFDTTSVEATVRAAHEANPGATIVIKSTVPVGYSAALCQEMSHLNLLFSPEFLREGHALEDNLNPSRIIVGVPEGSDATVTDARRFASIMAEATTEGTAPILTMSSTEAEAVKLFANSYLALRVAFFNELDTYAVMRGLNTRNVIEGMGLDARIGTHYNNPSFGYGGYCLPKDTKQLLANFHDVPERLVRAVVESNHTRKDFIARDVIRLLGDADAEGAVASKTVGVYRLVMKQGSDNFRSSSVISVIHRLRAHDIPLLIYEPALENEMFEGIEVTNDLESFKLRSDLILANRWDEALDNVADKVYTRDIFRRD